MPRPAALLQNINLCDDDIFEVHAADGEWLGNVQAIYGESGWDVIADYHEDVEPLLARANAISEEITDAMPSSAVFSGAMPVV